MKAVCSYEMLGDIHRTAGAVSKIELSTVTAVTTTNPAFSSMLLMLN